MAARANQIARELTVSDHGIDMEIEFKTDDGEATGRKLYLLLDVDGDSHLHSLKGGRAGRAQDVRHVDGRTSALFPVMLVSRQSDGWIEWMELRRAPAQGHQRSSVEATSDVVHAGERFDVMSIRRWRDRVLGAP